MKRKLTKMEKFLLAAVVLAGCFYLYLNKVYDPKMELYKSTLDKIQGVQQEIAGIGEIADLGKMTEKVAEEKKQLRELEARAAELDSRKVRAAAEGSAVVKKIKELALRNGLKIMKLKIVLPGEEEEKAEARKKSAAKKKTPTVNDQAGGGEDGVTKGNVPLPEAVTMMEWTEYTLSLEGDHRGLVGYVHDLDEKMTSCVVIKSIGVLMDENTGRLKIAMTLLI
ncbi:septal ring factor EnvC (AmiA/AmiB activator) [Desulfohalotomaculum tongense]|uniref:hypothetical protein n=1 Tax=Desulforadius tongensis TaxID=1216062 RepID=UPI001958D676|nr:hypothetical protein [Desulforadius tongensis]MBM7854495.1 septal ring factor EnvC (AmiA/AmiB activator) [Desulforadius tongensis]